MKGMVIGRASAAVLALFFVALYSLTIGAYPIALTDLWQQDQVTQILVYSRIPRTLAVLISGAILGVLGCLSQAVMNNAFAEPTTLGTPQGIALGLLIGTLFFPAISLFQTMLFGVAFGLLSLLVFYFVVQKIALTDAFQLPLIGLVYSAVLSAGVTFLAFQYDQMQLLVVWLSGDFSTIIQGRYELLWGALGIGGVCYWMANQFSMLGMGEHLAKALGVPYQLLVFSALLMIAVATALVVVTVGMVSFLGLVVPNIVRMFIGDNLQRSLPWCAWFGALLLTVCDVLGRLLAQPLEVPASLVFAVCAGCVFFVLLWRGNSHAN